MTSKLVSTTLEETTVLSSLSHDFIQLTRTNDILTKCISAINALKSASTSDTSKKTYSFSEIQFSVETLFRIITSSLTSEDVQTVGISLLKMLNSNVKDVTGKVEQLTTIATKMTKFNERVASSLTKVQETAESFNGEKFSSSEILLIAGDGSGFTNQDGTEVHVQKSKSVLTANLQILAQNTDAVEKVISIITMQSEKEDQEEEEEDEKLKRNEKKSNKSVKFTKFLTEIKKFSTAVKEIKQETFYSMKFQSLALSIVAMFSRGIKQGTPVQYEQLSKQKEIFTHFASNLHLEVNKILIDFRSVTGLKEFTIKDVGIETIDEDGLGIFGKSGTSSESSGNFWALNMNVFNIKKSEAAISVLKKILADESVGSSETAISSSKYIAMLTDLIQMISVDVFDSRIQSKTFELYDMKINAKVMELSEEEKVRIKSFTETVEKVGKIIESSKKEILEVYKKSTGKEFSEEEMKEIPTITEKGDLTETTISKRMSFVNLNEEGGKIVQTLETLFGMQISIYKIMRKIQKSSFSKRGSTIEFSDVKHKIKEIFSLLEENSVSENIAKFGKDLEFFTNARVVGFKDSDNTEMFKQYKKLTEYIMTLTKKMALYAQNVEPSKIKKAIVSLMEVEDGIPKVREAVEKVKNPVAEDQTYNCKKMMGKLRHMTNTLINTNTYKHCIAAELVSVLPVGKPEKDCSKNVLMSYDKLLSRLEDYENQIPRMKSKLMDIYFELTDTKFDESTITLENVFKEDGSFENGKGTDCKK